MNKLVNKFMTENHLRQIYYLHLMLFTTKKETKNKKQHKQDILIKRNYMKPDFSII